MSTADSLMPEWCTSTFFKFVITPIKYWHLTSRADYMLIVKSDIGNENVSAMAVGWVERCFKI